MVDEEEFKVEGVGLLEALQSRSVDEVLDDVVFQQFDQTGRIGQDGVQLRWGNQREGLVGRGE